MLLNFQRKCCKLDVRMYSQSKANQIKSRQVPLVCIHVPGLEDFMAEAAQWGFTRGQRILSWHIRCNRVINFLTQLT